MLERTQKRRRPRQKDIFQQFFNKFLPFWPLFLLLLVISLAAGYFYAKWKTPLYEIHATLLIKDEQKGIKETISLESLNLFRGKKIVENEIEILQSHTFLQQAAINLGLYAPIQANVRGREIPAYDIAPVHIFLKYPEQLTEVKKVQFSFDSTRRVVTIGKKAYPLNQWTITEWGEMIFIPWHLKADVEETEYFFSLVKPQKIANGIAAGLLALPSSKQSSVVNLKYKDNVQKRGVDVLNEIIRLYSDQETQEKYTMAENTLAIVEQRLKKLVGQLDSVETAIERFRSSTGSIDLSQQGKEYLQNVVQYDRQAENIQNQLAILDDVEKFVMNKNRGAAIVSSSLGLSDPVLDKLLNTLNDYQLQYERLSKTTAEQSPIMVSLRNQMDMLKPTIVENINNQRRSYEISRNNIINSSRRFSGMLSTVPIKEKQLIEISRQQAVKNQIYAYLLQKREEAALSYISASIRDTKVIDQAYALLKPVSPNKMLIYLASPILGLLLGLSLVTFREDFSKAVLFRKDLEEKLPLPVAGEIMHAGKSVTLLSEVQQHRGALAQIQAIRNQLLSHPGDQSPQKICICSTSPDEGKSFLAANLGASLAGLGYRVLLVDLDFSHRKLTKMFDADQKKGITDYVLTPAFPIRNFISNTAVENLRVLGTGSAAGSGSDIVMRRNFRELLDAMAAEADFLIICTGGLEKDINTVSISGMADLTFFMVRHGVSGKATLSSVVHEGKLDQLNNAQIIFNDVRGRGIGKKRFGSDFGFGYHSKSAT